MSRQWWTWFGLGSLSVLGVVGFLLYPGFILTLDATAVPSLPSPVWAQGVFVGSAPFRILHYALNLLVPGWVLQKIVLLAMFALAEWSAYRFLLSNAFHRVSRFFSALFFLLNPFVYTRFLAGHWMHLFAYALLPWIWHQSLQLAGLREEAPWKRAWMAPVFLGLSLALVFMFSLHIGVMATMVTLATLISGIPKKGRGDYLERGVVAVLVLLVATLYWTIPYIFQASGTILAQFDERHWMAYRTIGDQTTGVMGSVLSLYGFWGDAYPWAAQFLWPRSIPWLYVLTGLALAAVVISGIVAALRQRENQRATWLMLVFLAVAFVFSCGVGESPFYSFNYWLFQHVGFWRGFRDSQKWSALIVLAYAYFFGGGIEWVMGRPWKSWIRHVLVGFAGMAVLAYTWPMLGGFWGQLRPVWYPVSWMEADALLQKDPDCVAVFIPWHGYKSFGFANKILIANPAGSFFHCRMVLTRQVELGPIRVQSVPDPAYDAIDGVMTGRDGWSPEEAVKVLRSAGIKYVISSSDAMRQDLWTYDFIHSSSVEVVKAWSDLSLYRITR